MSRRLQRAPKCSMSAGLLFPRSSHSCLPLRHASSIIRPWSAASRSRGAIPLMTLSSSATVACTIFRPGQYLCAKPLYSHRHRLGMLPAQRGTQHECCDVKAARVHAPRCFHFRKLRHIKEIYLLPEVPSCEVVVLLLGCQICRSLSAPCQISVCLVAIVQCKLSLAADERMSSPADAGMTRWHYLCHENLHAPTLHTHIRHTVIQILHGAVSAKCSMYGQSSFWAIAVPFAAASSWCLQVKLLTRGIALVRQFF
jgi:hypothetical protein